jgi:hypothetical protein
VSSVASTGLVVYLSGDTFTIDPKEAPFVLNDQLRSASVIASYANEETTKNGKVVTDTRTETFMMESRVHVHLLFSGKVIEFVRS